MFSETERFLEWRLILLALALFSAVSISADNAIAGKPTGAGSNSAQAAP